MATVLVFDIETIPDVAGLRRVEGYPDSMSDAEVAAKAMAERAEKTGSEFLPLFLQRVVAISCVIRRTTKEGAPQIKVGTLGNPDDDEKVKFLPSESAPDAPVSIVKKGHAERTVEIDLLNRSATYRTVGEGGVFGEGVRQFDETGTSLSHDLTRELTISADEPLCAKYVITQAYEMGREGWMTRSEARLEMTSTLNDFHVKGTLDVYENDVKAASREWNETIPRDLV